MKKVFPQETPPPFHKNRAGSLNALREHMSSCYAYGYTMSDNSRIPWF